MGMEVHYTLCTHRCILNKCKHPSNIYFMYRLPLSLASSIPISFTHSYTIHLVVLPKLSRSNSPKLFSSLYLPFHLFYSVSYCDLYPHPCCLCSPFRYFFVNFVTLTYLSIFILDSLPFIYFYRVLIISFILSSYFNCRVNMKLHPTKKVMPGCHNFSGKYSNY